MCLGVRETCLGERGFGELMGAEKCLRFFKGYKRDLFRDVAEGDFRIGLKGNYFKGSNNIRGRGRDTQKGGF